MYYAAGRDLTQPTPLRTEMGTVSRLSDLNLVSAALLPFCLLATAQK